MKNNLKLYFFLSVFSNSLFAQIPYPDRVVEGVSWSSGTQNIMVPERIISPFSAANSVTISNTAQVDFVSGTEVQLNDDFHAGSFSNTGYFHATVQNVNLDMKLVSPDPSQIVDNFVHVNKWEKFEVAFKLPAEYETAVTSFFTNYYGGTPNPVTDLNPYADDSLEVKVDLISPNGIHYTKWAFFMRQGTFDANPDATSILIEDVSHPLHNFNWHFRFSPDEENSTTPWTFSISVSAPLNSTFPVYHYSGYCFICDPALAANHGFLKVNPLNNKYLKFDDNTNFFGIGENMADQRHWFSDPYRDWLGFFKKDYNNYINNFSDMNSVGANYMRMWMFKYNFSIEAENLGVYDQFSATPCCCSDGSPHGDGGNRSGNRQWNLNAFDNLIEEAHEKEIYIQLLIEADVPASTYQDFESGNNCYMINYVYPTGTLNTVDDWYGPSTLPRYDGPYLHPEYFYISDPINPNVPGGSLYYWKRRYKYLSSRLGYSTNIASFETFNEIDLTLMYHEDMNLTNSSSTCDNNKVDYSDPNLLNAHMADVQNSIYDWHTYIGSYLKNDLSDKHMLTVSNTPWGTYWYWWMAGSGYHPREQAYFHLFENPQIDLVDIHDYSNDQGMFGGNRYDTPNIAGRYWKANEFVNCDQCPGGNGNIYEGLNLNKPFHFGECSTFGETYWDNTTSQWVLFPPFSSYQQTSTTYHNYDVSFHNELWATAFLGTFTTGLTWQWEVIHWWQEGTPVPEDDSRGISLTNQLNQPNEIFIDNWLSQTVYNKTSFHNYKKLSEFLQFVTPYLSQNQLYTQKFYNYNSTTKIGAEAYYMTIGATSAFGWVHNLNSYWQNAYYYGNPPDPLNPGTFLHFDNYYGCTNSNTYFDIEGLAHVKQFEVTFYPTRLGVYSVPPPFTTWSNMTGSIRVPISLGCDTTNADYAFVVAEIPMRLANKAEEIFPNRQIVTSDFDLFPNPTNSSTVIHLNKSTEEAVNINITDLLGKKIRTFDNVKEIDFVVDLNSFLAGIYYVNVSSKDQSKTKILTIL